MSKKNSNDVLVDVQNVSKKYCRQLHRSLRYGVMDLAREGLGISASSKLRPGEFFAVKNASFRVHRGEAVQLMGPNGAGKTTMMKMLNGLLKPNSGRIRLRGRIATLTSLGAGFNPILSGRENIYINGTVLGFTRQQITENFKNIVEFSEIEYAIEDPVKTYSSGMKSRLGYSIAVNLKPDLLLLDEVLAAGDRGFKAKCYAHLNSLVQQGTAIIIISHIGGNRIGKFCKRAIVFNKGTTEFDGDYKEGYGLYEKLVNVQRIKEIKSQPVGQKAVAWIDEVELVNKRGRVLQEATHGRDISFRIHLMAKSRIESPRLAISIESSAGIVSTMSTNPGDFELDEQGKTVELSVPNLSLLRGTYIVNAELLGPRQSNVFYHLRRGALVLKVNSRASKGVLAMDHDWEF